MRDSLPIVDSEIGALEGADRATASRKLAELRSDLSARVLEGALVAFSGGLDSAFLLWVAHGVSSETDGRLVALTTTSPSTPFRDMEDAIAFTRSLGVDHVWRESLEVSQPEYIRNDRERCYHCKTELFRIDGGIAT